MLNQAFFDKLFLSWEDADVLVGEVAANDLFTILFDPESFELRSSEMSPARSETIRNRGGLKCESRRPTLVASATLNGLSSCNEHLVREGGLEPPRPFGHRNLNPARLPIPPLPQEVSDATIADDERTR